MFFAEFILFCAFFFLTFAALSMILFQGASSAITSFVPIVFPALCLLAILLALVAMFLRRKTQLMVDFPLHALFLFGAFGWSPLFPNPYMGLLIIIPVAFLATVLLVQYLRFHRFLFAWPWLITIGFFLDRMLNK